MPYKPLVFELYQNFDFEQATPEQKEVLARENAHCQKTFPASTYDFKTRYCTGDLKNVNETGVYPSRYRPPTGAWGVW